MRSIHYNGQKFKKRLSKEELKLIAKNCFQKNGMDKYIQSRILSDLCDYVKKSKNPKFFSLISSPKNKNSIAWIRAYSLVLKYLEEFKMISTINAMYKESEKLKVSYDLNFLNQNLPSQFFRESIRTQKRNRKKFSIRVKLCKIPPPLVISQNDDKNKNKVARTQQNKSNSAKNNVMNTNIQNNLANDEVSYISGDENSHFNVSSIDVLADDSLIGNE
ncbi:hypothetical protein M9Y10_008503 [Tritrichomonas musculus]|uniref:Uncharacterized protein n=1 Tax=Tritrichomonas musculus TaxID=1915356 RepID=A0ABR2IYD3_9EUKA